MLKLLYHYVWCAGARSEIGGRVMICTKERKRLGLLLACALTFLGQMDYGFSWRSLCNLVRTLMQVPSTISTLFSGQTNCKEDA